MLFFNLGNLFADCRLGEVQSVSSLREVQFLSQNKNCVQVTYLNVGEHSPNLVRCAMDFFGTSSQLNALRLDAESRGTDAGSTF